MVFIFEAPFGTSEETGEDIRLYTIKNDNNISVQVMTLGAIVVSIRCPDKNGVVDDIVMGFKNPEEFCREQSFGATFGKISHLKFKPLMPRLAEYVQDCVEDDICLEKVVWESTIEDDKVVLSYIRKFCEGDRTTAVSMTAIFKLTNKNEFKIRYKATTTRAVQLGITNRTVFNLGGLSCHSEDPQKHQVLINTIQQAVANDDKISIDKLPIPKVVNLEVSLKKPMPGAKFCGSFVSDVVGYSNLYSLPGRPRLGKIRKVAKIRHADNGRLLKLSSNSKLLRHATVHCVNQNHGSEFCDTCGMILETQKRPFQPNISRSADILLPESCYKHTIVYKFSTSD